MIVSMPDGNSFGWGIAGTNLRRELSKLPSLDGVTLHCIARHDFEPRDPEEWNAINIGYCFFEHDILAYHFLPAAAPKWDFIVAGSRWCEHHLRIAGVQHTTTILQGIDPSLFSYHPPRRADGRFIVFSGGKFEFRKGQDIVIAAMQVFMSRHPDVWFACSWHNQWEKSIKTMEQSRLIQFQHGDMPCEEFYRQTLQANGIDMSRVLLHPLADNSAMARIYAESDIGLFPNRCEGGNNLVMCEYMACGRPVIASTLTGHADVITANNAFGLTQYAPIVFRLDAVETGVWFEPSVDEVVTLLERAYADRALVNRKGISAAAEMQRLSWPDAALRFHRIAAHLYRKRQAMESHPAEDRLDVAERYFNGGRYLEAETVYRSLLKENPLNAELYNCLGTVLDRLERYTEASLHYSKAIALQPALTVARYNLANTLKKLGKIDECSAMLEEIVQADPNFVNAWQNLGVCRYEAQNFVGAAACFERVVALDPERSGGLASLGEIYFKAGVNLERGIECLAQALDKQPGLIELLNLMGLMYHELEQYEAAEQCYRKGLEIAPRNAILLSNIGNMYLAMAMPEKAIMYFNLALEVDPDNGSIIFNRAMSRLLLGDFRRGWLDYEARFDKQEPVIQRHSDLPRWRGESLAGRTLLVWAEQVYGDTIQFGRYLPLMDRFGGRIVFECLDLALAPLFADVPGVDEMRIRGQALPPADFQIPLVGLPQIFGTAAETIPFPEGYLRPDPVRLGRWQERIRRHAADRLAIGLVWGGRKPRLNANRSMQLRDLDPLLQMSGICWFSLQTGDDRAQLAAHNAQIIDLVDDIADFADTAAILAALDLVITIDTATAHLAGSLGVPVWVMLKSSPDWRWLLDRRDSPWYASATLFRQPAPGDWASVVAEIRSALEKKIT